MKEAEECDQRCQIKSFRYGDQKLCRTAGMRYS